MLIVGTLDFVDAQAPSLPATPMKTRLEPGHPNPFHPNTVIRYEVARAGIMHLRIYDVRGALVQTLTSQLHEPGRYEQEWNGRNQHRRPVASGVYYVRLSAGDVIETQKLPLRK